MQADYRQRCFVRPDALRVSIWCRTQVHRNWNIAIVVVRDRSPCETSLY